VGEAKRNEESKAEAFAREPEFFEDIRTQLMAIKRDGDGRLCAMVNAEKPEDCFLLLGAAVYNLMTHMNIMAIKSRNQTQSGIVKPTSGVPGNGKGFFGLGRK